MYVSLDRLRDAGKELASNDSASLLDLGDGVLLAQVSLQGNAIDAQIVEMGNRGIHELSVMTWSGSSSATRQELLRGGQPRRDGPRVKNERPGSDRKASRPCRTS